jgi:hypothetical protein
MGTHASGAREAGVREQAAHERQARAARTGG